MMPQNPERRLKILLCGYGHLGVALLQGLIACQEQCELVGVFRWTSRPGGNAYWEPIEDDFKRMVSESHLSDVNCKGMNSFDFIQLLQDLAPDVVLVGSWGEILKSHLLELPGMLFINCHPSRLPAHRGANPYASVILQRETETGVTFHRITSKIDAGAIVLQESVPISDQDNGELVRERCAQTAAQMVPALVERLAAHVLRGEPLGDVEQDIAQKSYFGQLRPEQGEINWQDAPEKISRQIRALYPWVACYSFLEGRRGVVFYDPFFKRLEALPEQAAAPGTILSFEKGVVRVALSDPQWVLEVTSYQIAASQKAFLPPWIGRYLAPLMLRAGKRFYTWG